MNRYETNREILASYRDMILPDQVRAYRALYDRYQHDSEGVDFNDLISAQQTLASAVATYAQSIGDTWQAVVDLASVMQLEQLGQMHCLGSTTVGQEPVAPNVAEPTPAPPPVR